MTRASTENGTKSSVVIWIACLAYIIGFAAFYLEASSIRYVIYLLPFLLFTALFCERNPQLYRPAEIFFLIYVSIGLMGLFIMGIQNISYFLSEYVIISLIALCFVPAISASRNHIRFIFFFSVTWLVFAFFADNKSLRIFSIMQNAIPDQNAYDHALGLLTPIFSVFFAAVGGKIEFILAFVMTILAGKRIAMLGMLVGIISFFLFNRIVYFKKRETRFLFLLMGLAAINVAAVNLTSLAEYTHSELRLEANIEQIMMGRYLIGNEINGFLVNRSWLESIMGSGPGSAAMVASAATNGVLTLNHNDWVKILVDYGILGSILITTFMAFIFSSSRMSMSIALTSAVIMMTDNVLIYLYYQFPIVLILAYARLRKFQETGIRQYRPPPQRNVSAAGAPLAV